MVPCGMTTSSGSLLSVRSLFDKVRRPRRQNAIVRPSNGAHPDRAWKQLHEI